MNAMNNLSINIRDQVKSNTLQNICVHVFTDMNRQ